LDTGFSKKLSDTGFRPGFSDLDSIWFLDSFGFGYFGFSRILKLGLLDSDFGFGFSLVLVVLVF
jgi:hypothetical protein